MAKLTMRVILTLLLLGGTLNAEPVYNATAAPILQSGQYYTVWSAETPTPGNGTTAASQQLALQTSPGRAGTPFSVDGQFSGAPCTLSSTTGACTSGTAEIDVQVAAQDTDTAYQTCSNCAITTFDPTNFTFHLDGTNTTERFVRLLMRSRTNSVTITATITGG